MKRGLFFVLFLLSLVGWSQVKGRVSDGIQPIAGVTVYFPSIKKRGVTNLDGVFIFDYLPMGSYTVVISYVGFLPQKKTLTISKAEQDLGEFLLLADSSLEEVIISGNLKPVNRLESTIPVEIYSPEFFTTKPIS